MRAALCLRSFSRQVFVTCLAFAFAVPASAGAQSRFSGLVVFGTSLSDSGNAFALSGDAGTPPDFFVNPLLIPSAPYAAGGHHFSNGATWIEQYARSGRAESINSSGARHYQPDGDQLCCRCSEIV